jgi:hypothetical protein
MNKSMENRFKELKEGEVKGMLLLRLIKETKGILTKKECENIIQQLKTVEINDIKVIRDAKEFAQVITLGIEVLEHSWAGRKEHIESGQVLIGEPNIHFGKDRSYVYSFNGDIKEDTQEKEDPDFSVNEKYVVVLETINKSDYNNDYYDYLDRNIYVYYPEEEPYKIDPEVKYILDNFTC